MKTFITALLKGPKRFEKIGEALPHKTSKEIVFFYQTQKKLLKLNREIKNARELLKMKMNNGPLDSVFEKEADKILEPLQAHILKQRIDLSFGMGPKVDSNQAKNSIRNNEKLMGQTRFTIEDLIQIFAAANQSDTRRRRPWLNSYISVNDQLISKNPPSQGLYHHNTFRVKDEALGCPTLNMKNPDV